MGAVMIAKCSNPSCAASFLYLKEGRLFRLENDPTLKSCNVTTREYFWLFRSNAVRLWLSVIAYNLIHCQFVDKSGKVVLERDITGKVRFMGGNLRATYDFAKKGAKVVQENF
jgi:hypothetical protein